jgi:serine/threonine protein phosphatase PrpC
MEEAAIHAIGRGVAAVFSAGCPGRAGANEDAAALIPLDGGSAVLAVADGLGGTPLGDHAASLAMRSLVEALAPAERERSRLRDAILNASSANEASRARRWRRHDAHGRRSGGRGAPVPRRRLGDPVGPARA